MSRTVNGEWLFADVEKEILRTHIWQVAEYCGIRIVTYAVMANHFHVVVCVPKKEKISDCELLRRYMVLHRNPTPWQKMRLEVIERMLDENGEAAERWRLRQLAMMGDISPFMQLLKQRFSIWFNRTHDRFGTLWSERFKSVVLDPEGPAVLATSAYVDRNAVRAGLVEDPKEYRFCGYAEAVAGNQRARAGIELACPRDRWEQTQSAYRSIVHLGPVCQKKNVHSAFALCAQSLNAERSVISLGEILRCRVKYMTDGAVLGGKAFVLDQLMEYRRRTGRGKLTEPRFVPEFGDIFDLAVLRNLRLP